VYFDEIDGRRFVPRALLMDLEPGAIDEVQFGAYGNVFSPDKMLRGDRSASNNYGKGYYTDGADLSSAAMEMIRKEAEKCDCIQVGSSNTRNKLLKIHLTC
ncbi:Tubulin beta-2 chain, partial [Toxocara canis]